MITRVGDPYIRIFEGPTPATGVRFVTSDSLPIRDDSKMDVLNLFALNPLHPNPAKLPDPLHVGRRVKFSWHLGFKEVYYTGVITSHYVDGDDCSGTWRGLKYGITRDDAPKGHEHYSVPVKYCELLD